ncbi:Kef-type K+ transport system membrane component KefB [Archangium gephyra]|uniref:Kef-type K+ transport system membrane component KefB n=1 Tax=Archangium gephyra TaxID=48 RepID=A0AAC8QDZ3_9BACT|nr:cation:proton antiporter [Archangium gephyra]AKJ05465.1 Sodium/hydrogen exchanger [Archangium gephyra]REG36148.1 Kef-type K+ transport system membrane component KefB [Archangium gephyra]
MQAIAHNALSLLIVQLVVIIGLSRLIGNGARWLGQPLVIAEVLAGILLGPSMLGWLAPGVMGALFPADSMPVLRMLSQLGPILFMFLIGLELDPRVLRGQGRASLFISHTSILVPFALGALAALVLHPRLSEPSVPFSSFVLFMGAAMSVTAFAVLARILSEHGLLRSKVGMLALTCAAVDDVTAWCLLAFVVSLVRASDLMHAGLTTLLALLYIGFMLGLVRPFLARLGARVANKEGLTQNVVALTLMMLLASAWATERIGIHALFGAFLFGLIVPKQGGLAEALAEKLEDVVVVLILPVFFAYSGLRTQVGLLEGASDWALCGLILLVACVGKFGGTTLAARLTGMRWREAGALGILLNTRGLIELIVLNIGLDLGVISPKLFTMMVIMALVTALMTSPLLRWMYPPEEVARDRVPLIPFIAPVEQAPFTVLMCVSQGETGTGMAVLARALTGTAGESFQFYALHLVPPAALREQEPGRGDALSALVERASGLGLQVRPLSFVSAEPALDICRTAEAKQAELILLGGHKPLVGRTPPGGTVHEVMREAGTDVAVLVDRGLERVRRVLVPLGGGEDERAVLTLARRLMRSSGAEVTVLRVTVPGRDPGPARSRALVDELFPEESGRVQFKTVSHESPEKAALEEARHGYDLMVLGMEAGGRWEDREVPTSVLVLHEPARATVTLASVS